MVKGNPQHITVELVADTEKPVKVEAPLSDYLAYIANGVPSNPRVVDFMEDLKEIYPNEDNIDDILDKYVKATIT